jgi:hypothetical protein
MHHFAVVLCSRAVVVQDIQSERTAQSTKLVAAQQAPNYFQMGQFYPEYHQEVKFNC